MCHICDAVSLHRDPAAAQNEVLRSIVVGNPQLRALLAVAFSLTGDHNRHQTAASVSTRTRGQLDHFNVRSACASWPPVLLPCPCAARFVGFEK